jgi:hypothetical protein
MTSEGDIRGRGLFVVAALAVVTASLVLQTGACQPDPRMARRAADRALEPIASTPPPSPRRRRVVSHVRAERVSAFARRFAAAYVRWDAGQRTTALRRRLRRHAAPAIWHALRDQHARPTAVRPRAARITAVLTARRGPARFWVAVLAGKSRAYYATLRIAATAGRLHVTAIQR